MTEFRLSWEHRAIIIRAHQRYPSDEVKYRQLLVTFALPSSGIFLAYTIWVMPNNLSRSVALNVWKSATHKTEYYTI